MAAAAVTKTDPEPAAPPAAAAAQQQQQPRYRDAGAERCRGGVEVIDLVGAGSASEADPAPEAPAPAPAPAPAAAAEAGQGLGAGADGGQQPAESQKAHQGEDGAAGGGRRRLVPQHLPLTGWLVPRPKFKRLDEDQEEQEKKCDRAATRSHSSAGEQSHHTTPSRPSPPPGGEGEGSSPPQCAPAQQPAAAPPPKQSRASPVRQTAPPRASPPRGRTGRPRPAKRPSEDPAVPAKRRGSSRAAPAGQMQQQQRQPGSARGSAPRPSSAPKKAPGSAGEGAAAAAGRSGARWTGDLSQLLATATEQEIRAAEAPKWLWVNARMADGRERESRRLAEQGAAYRASAEQLRQEAQQRQDELERVTQFTRTVMTEGARKQRDRLRLAAARKMHELGQLQPTALEENESFIDGAAFQRLKDQTESLDARRKSLESVVNSRRRQAAKRDSANPPAPAGGAEAAGGEEWQEPAHIQGLADRIGLHLVRKEIQDVQKQLAALRAERQIAVKEWKRQRDEDASRFRHFPELSGRYTLLTLIGKGGFSEVWKAFDAAEQRRVAVKVHQTEEGWPLERQMNYMRHARRECELQQSMRHPHIVGLLDFFDVPGDTPNAFATVMEYAGDTNEDLDTYLKRHRLLKERDARCLLWQILAALQYLASPRFRIIHYDLKPGNILFFGTMYIKITDFGLSKQMSREASDEVGIELTNVGAGTYWYLPPECFRGPGTRISTKVDVWSAGVIFYQMLFGRKPFGNDLSQRALLRQGGVVAQSLTFPNTPKISKGAVEVIQQMLAHHPTERPAVSQLLAGKYFASDDRGKEKHTVAAGQATRLTPRSRLKAVPVPAAAAIAVRRTPPPGGAAGAAGAAAAAVGWPPPSAPPGGHPPGRRPAL